MSAATEIQVLENLTEEECYLWALLTDESGLDQAEFLWYDPDSEDGCFRAWAFQWSWWRCTHALQIDQCFPGDTLVTTSRGQVPIKDIEVGDSVLTHTGNWKPVTYKWDRGPKETVVLKGRGHPGLVTTPNHKFWDGEMFSVPRAGSEWASPARFPIGSSVPPLPERAYAPGRPSNVPNDRRDPRFLWVYGLFLAEGSNSSSFGEGGAVNRTTFSINQDKVPEVESVLDAVEIRYNTQKIAKEHCSNIVVNSRQLAEWFVENGGRGAKNKFLAGWVYGLSAQQRQAVFDGAMAGDGYLARMEYCTTSKSLAVGLKLLGQSLGLQATFRATAARDNYIDGRLIKGSATYVVAFREAERPDAIHSWTPIKSREIGETVRVWDIEVADDHSFVADGIVVSNCARSVGKSLSIKVRGFSFPIVHPGNEMLITAPELVHLEPIVSLIESQIYATRFSRELLVQGRSGVTHRPFQMNFVNGARLIGRIPQRDGRGVKGVHPLWLEMDEAQDYPEKGWVELTETLKRGHEGAVWRSHGVTRGVRDDFFKHTQDTPDNEWTVHRFAAMWRPNWTDQERTEKIKQYGSRDDPDYRRNVLGLHGDATNPMFVLTRLMRCVDDDEHSEYNEDEFFRAVIKTETLAMMGQSVIGVMDYPSRHKSYMPKATYWCGMDVGFTIDPSEILTFVEFREKGAEQSKLKLLSRVNLQRMGTTEQTMAVLHTIDFYRPKVFAMDKTGLGLPLYQLIQEWSAERSEIRYVLDIIKGYNFSEKITVGFDDSVEVDELKGDPERDAGIRRTVLEYASDSLRTLVDEQRLILPWESDLLKQFQGSTWMSARGLQDQYGRRIFSKGNDHILDASRMAVLGWKQYTIEEVLKAPKDDRPVLDMFLV